jgi:hypothetical protein
MPFTTVSTVVPGAGVRAVRQLHLLLLIGMMLPKPTMPLTSATLPTPRCHQHVRAIALRLQLEDARHHPCGVLTRSGACPGRYADSKSRRDAALVLQPYTKPGQ